MASRIRRVDVTAAGHKVGVLTGRIARAELIRIAAGHGLHLVVVRTDPIARAFGIPRGVKVTAAGHKVVYVLIVPIARAEWIRKRVAIAAGHRVVVLPARIARAEWIRRDTAAGHKVVVQTLPIARFTEQEIVGIIWILDRIAADPRIEDPALRIAWILGCQGKLPSPDRGMATKNEGFKQIVVNWSCLVLQGVVCMLGVMFHNPSNSWHD